MTVGRVTSTTRSTDAPQFDLLLVIIIGALLCIGLIMVASASMSLAERDYDSPLYFFWRQLGAVAAGLAGAWFMVRTPTRTWERLGAPLMILAFAMLVLVLIPGLGRSANGSTRWLRIAGVNLIQVSEPARLLLLMYFAGYVVRRGRELRESFVGFLKPMAIAAAACVLLLIQPDYGASVMLMVITLSVLFVGGARIRDFSAICSVLLVAAVLLVVTKGYRMERVTTFMDPWKHAFDKTFQLVQSLIAIGTGEWTGLGLGASVQKLFYLPEAHTDFVYAVIAEEFGLLGSLIVIALFGLLTWRALVIAAEAARQNRVYQAGLAFGLAVWQAVQAFINIGVNMGILPTKGLTLPLISYGRSSILITLIALGLLLRIDLENRGEPGAARRRSAEPRVTP